MKKISLIVLTLLLAGCDIFEPIPESYKNKLAETPEPVVVKEQEQQETQETDDYDTTLIITPSTWFGIVTTDIVDYVNTVTGETATGPSHGGYLDNHPDWEMTLNESVL